MDNEDSLIVVDSAEAGGAADHRPSSSRRAVILGAAGIAAGFALGGIAMAFGSEKVFLRPPGGQNARLFSALCIRCDRCRSACHLNAIGIMDVEESLAFTRTPVMRFRLGYCDMCDGDFKCIAACPTGALGAFDPSVDHMGIAEVDTDVCLLYGRSARCDARCVSACDYDALLLSDTGRLSVDEDKCNGCGACEYVCVSKSYGSYGASGNRGVNVRVKR